MISNKILKIFQKVILLYKEIEDGVKLIEFLWNDYTVCYVGDNPIKFIIWDCKENICIAKI